MSEFGVKPGLKGKAEITVKKEHLASSIESGLVDVLATPWMIALMEKAASNAVQGLLPKGFITVGYRVDVTHLKPVPLGEKVEATARLVAVEGRRLVFRVEARCRGEKIGEGQHERVVVNLNRFMEKISQSTS